MRRSLDDVEDPISNRLNRLLGGLRALRAEITRRPILTYEPHAVQLAAHQDLRRIVIYCGANRAGKTYWLAREICWCIEGTHPFKKPHKGPFKVYLVGTKYEKLAENVLPAIFACFPPSHPLHPRWDKELNIIYFPNGVTLHIFSMKSDITSFAGGDPVLVAIDEEPPRKIWSEIVARIISSKGQILIAATSVPEEGVTWIYDELLKKIPDFRTSKTGGSYKGIGAYRATMFDNPYLDKAVVRELMEEMDPAEIPARVYGDPTPIARHPVFPPSWLDAMEDKIRFQEWTGDISYLPYDVKEEPEFLENPIGSLRVWVWPRKGRRYIIGVDTAKGIGEKGDFNVASVLDWTTFEEVAQLRSNTMSPDEFADAVAGLGYHYNCALIAPEIAKEGYVVATRLRLVHKYPNLYRSFDLVKADIVESRDVGWFTNENTKPRMMGKLRSAISPRGRLVTIFSELTWREMRGYNRNPQTGKMDAMTGLHDDCVVALAIAYYVATTTMIDTVPWRPDNRKKSGGRLSQMTTEMTRPRKHPYSKSVVIPLFPERERRKKAA